MNTKRAIVALGASLTAVCYGYSHWASSSCAAEPAAIPVSAEQKLDRATPDAAWDRLFTRSDGWTGGDVVGTVDLGDERVLWLFGDTWIGRIVADRHPPGTPMVHNSIALQPLGHTTNSPGSRAAGGVPAKSEIHFYWNATAPAPHAWIAPASADLGRQPQQADTTAADWYWPTGSGVVVPGPEGRRKLVIFFAHIGRRSQKQTWIGWDFKSLGCAMAIVDDIAKPVEKWNVRPYDVPFAIGKDQAIRTAESDPRRRETSWGLAVCRDRTYGAARGGWLYIYGVRNQSSLNRQLLLARAKVDSPSQFDAWQFFTGQDKWSASPDDAVPIAEGVANELSIEQVPQTAQANSRRPRWIMVYSEPALGSKIFVRTANRPQGPWSDRKEIYSVAEVTRNRTYYAYAAKGHFALSGPGELLISYIVGSHDFGEMARDATIYRPRFIRVPLAAILP